MAAGVVKAAVALAGLAFAIRFLPAIPLPDRIDPPEWLPIVIGLAVAARGLAQPWYSARGQDPG
jgi:hypothetical protein